MNARIILLFLLLAIAPPGRAEIGIGIELPGISVGINLASYPELVRVPGYPVYYAPAVAANLFFYDGFYWLYAEERWFSSAWYNGPWTLVDVEVMPLFLLRVPVQYYRQRAIYFHEWANDEAPRWGERWGTSWQNRHAGWNRWDRGAVPPPAPLPDYQRQYAGDRYPHGDDQRALRQRNYNYQPRDVNAHPVAEAQHRPGAAPDNSPRTPTLPLQPRKDQRGDVRGPNDVPPQRAPHDNEDRDRRDRASRAPAADTTPDATDAFTPRHSNARPTTVPAPVPAAANRRDEVRQDARPPPDNHSRAPRHDAETPAATPRSPTQLGTPPATPAARQSPERVARPEPEHADQQRARPSQERSNDTPANSRRGDDKHDRGDRQKD